MSNHVEYITATEIRNKPASPEEIRFGEAYEAMCQPLLKQMLIILERRGLLPTSAPPDKE